MVTGEHRSLALDPEHELFLRRAALELCLADQSHIMPAGVAVVIPTDRLARFVIAELGMERAEELDETFLAVRRFHVGRRAPVDRRKLASVHRLVESGDTIFGGLGVGGGIAGAER